MTILFLVLIVVAALCLGFIVLIQNPKGGGLTGDVSGLSNQFMGVKQTTDTLEKGTWIFAGFLVIACLGSSFLLKPGKNGETGVEVKGNGKSTGDNIPQKGPTQQMPNTNDPNAAPTAPSDSTK